MRARKLSSGEVYHDGLKEVNLWRWVMSPEEFLGDVKEGSLKMVKAGMETWMQSVRDERVLAKPHERSDARQDRRNGYYVRKGFKTAIGVVRGLRVPRCRRQSLMQELRERMRRAQGAVEAKAVEMFLKGVSTRQVGELLDGLVGVSMSAAKVSQLTKQLDVEVSRFHRSPLEDRYRYLFLDAIWLKSRTAPRMFKNMPEARRRVVLVAYGVTRQGVKELIAFRLESSETKAGWRRFLLSLQQRGLTGETLELVVTDGGKGLIEAVADCFPQATHQRCWFHKLSNVMGKVRVKNRGECLKGLRAVYDAPSRSAAEKAYGRWAKRWAREEPAAVRCVEKDLEALLVFYAMPLTQQKMVRTTNAIERCFREVRRRTRSIGCFINDASVERILYGLFRFMNERRAGKVCKEFKAAMVAA
jgi:transposase-like protein